MSDDFIKWFNSSGWNVYDSQTHELAREAFTSGHAAALDEIKKKWPDEDELGEWIGTRWDSGQDINGLSISMFIKSKLFGGE